MSEQNAETLKDCNIKVKHLTNSLGQIVAWIKAVEHALLQLDPNMEIKLPLRECTTWQAASGPVITHMNCPPPD